MPTVNVQGSGRTPIIIDSQYQYWPYPTATDADRARLAKLNRAISILDRYVARGAAVGRCDAHFRGLPRARSFRESWTDPTIILSYNPGASGIFGHAQVLGQDVAITRWCLDNHNRFMVAATLVHEMAHIEGAGADHAAERSVHQCGLRELYLPDVMGQVTVPGLANTLQAYG